MLGLEREFRKIARTLGRGVSHRKRGMKTEEGQPIGHSEPNCVPSTILNQTSKKRECNAVAMTHPVKVHRKTGSGVVSGENRRQVKHVQSVSATRAAKVLRKYIDSRSGLEQFLFWNRNNHKGQDNAETFLFNDSSRKFIEIRKLWAFFEYGHWGSGFQRL